MNDMNSDGAEFSRRWLLGAAVASTAGTCAAAAAGTLVYKATGSGDDSGAAATPVGQTGLSALTLSAPLHHNQGGSATLLNTTLNSTITGTVPGMTLDSRTRMLSGTPTTRSFLLKETLNGVSRDTLLFAPKTGQHAMRVGMGVANVNYYTPNNIFIDYLKYAGTLSPAGTSDANGMPLTLGVDGNGRPGVAYLMMLDSVNSGGSKFHVITDGDMDFEGHVKEGSDWVRRQAAGRTYVILTITAIRRPPTYLKYVREDEVAAARAGEIFKPLFLQEMSRFSHVRYMNWNGGNFAEPCTISEAHLLYSDHYQVPLSVIAKACKQARHDLYINIHHKTTVETFLRDYVPILDDLIASGRNVYIEHSNEVWNSQFQQKAFGDAAAQQMGYAGNPYFGSTWWNGYRTALMAKASRGKGYRWLVGVQTAQQPMLAALLVEGMNRVPGRQDSDIWGYHVTTYASGTLTLGVGGQLGAQQDEWVATGNYDAAFDNVLTYNQPVPGAESYAIDHFAQTHWVQAKAIAAAHGWQLVGYEGNFHLNAQPYSRNPSTYGPFFYRMIEHPLAAPATHYCLESAEEAGFAFVTMFDWGTEPGNSDNGRFGLYGHPGYDAVVAWNANLASGTGGTIPAPAPVPAAPFQLSELPTLRERFTVRSGVSGGKGERLTTWTSSVGGYSAVGGERAVLRADGWSPGVLSIEVPAGALIRTDQMQGDAPFTMLFVFRVDNATGSRTLVGSGYGGVSIDITDARLRLVKQFVVDLAVAPVGNAVGKHIVTVRYDPMIGVSLRYDGVQVATLPARSQGFSNQPLTLGRNTQAPTSADLMGAFGTFARCTSYLSDALVARWENYEKAQLGI